MTEKGYELDNVVEDNGGSDYKFLGTIGNSDARFTLRFSIDDEFVQVTITTNDLVNPAQIYESLVRSLKSKYGKEVSSQDKRSSQYMNITSQTQISQGIRLGEVYWLKRWEDEDDALEIETLKGGTVRLDYFSQYWQKEYERRQKGKTDDL